MTDNNSLPPGELEQLAREESHPSALLTEADMRKFRNELTAHAYDTLALCPDHRDKATGRCIVCVAEERVRQEMKAPADPPVPAALDALLRKWRDWLYVCDRNGWDRSDLRMCADELEAALRAAGPRRNPQLKDEDAIETALAGPR